MTCLDMLFMSLDEVIDCEIDCIGCMRTDCEDDRRNRRGNEKSLGGETVQS